MKSAPNNTPASQTAQWPARFASSSYAVPIAISVAMHAVMVILVVWGWQTTSAPKQKVVPRFVEATLVTITPQTTKPAASAPKPKVVDVAAKQQQLQQEKLKAEAEQKKRLATEQAERERLRKLAEEKKKKEQELAEKKKKDLAEAEKKRLEQARLEQERLKKLEQQRRQEAAFNDALAEEEALLSAQQSEVTAQSYVAIMAQRIERSWSRPPSARTGMQCELRIQMVPTGQVISVTVTKSSGNPAFDRSAVAAVERIGRFEELQKVPSDVFEQHFRQVTLSFNPQDLRL